MNKVLFEKEKQWLLDEKYGGEKSAAFFTDAEHLKSGEPLAYIIGNMPFYNCIIDLEYKPLIPRPETEFWVHDFVENEIKTKKQHAIIHANDGTKEKIKILDIFSGSGCIGISVLKNTENVSVDFAELNPKFIKQIQKNINLNISDKQGLSEIYQSDVFESIPNKKKYDYILANPPYIPESKSEKVQESVKKYEDHYSLFAPDNGLYFVKRTILEGLLRLKQDGKMYIEFDETSKNNILEFLEKKNITNFAFRKDQFDNDRVLIVWN